MENFCKNTRRKGETICKFTLVLGSNTLYEYRLYLNIIFGLKLIIQSTEL